MHGISSSESKDGGDEKMVNIAALEATSNKQNKKMTSAAIKKTFSDDESEMYLQCVLMWNYKRYLS